MLIRATLTFLWLFSYFNRKGLVMNKRRVGPEDQVLGHVASSPQGAGSQHTLLSTCWVTAHFSKVLKSPPALNVAYLWPVPKKNRFSNIALSRFSFKNWKLEKKSWKISFSSEVLLASKWAPYGYFSQFTQSSSNFVHHNNQLGPKISRASLAAYLISLAQVWRLTWFHSRKFDG